MRIFNLLKSRNIKVSKFVTMIHDGDKFIPLDDFKNNDMKELRILIEDQYYKYANKNTHRPEFLVLNDEDERTLQYEYKKNIPNCVGFYLYMGMKIIPTPVQPKGTCHVYSLND